MSGKSNEERILATADFHLTGTGYDNSVIDEVVHAELLVSGASQYGNQTCMTFEWINRHDCGRFESFDTRYERVSPENFKKFAKNVLKNRILKTVKVEEI